MGFFNLCIIGELITSQGIEKFSVAYLEDMSDHKISLQTFNRSIAKHVFSSYDRYSDM